MSPSKEPRLPLIRCPICNVGTVKWFVSSTAKNPGRHFYRCEYQGKGCSFWKWENEYADYLRTRWGHISAVPAPSPDVQVQIKVLLLHTLSTPLTFTQLLLP